MNYCFTDNFPRKLLYYFSSSIISDEFYFQTLFENSGFKNETKGSKFYIRWDCKKSPCIINDLNVISQAINSSQLFVRKIRNKTICEIINNKTGLKECSQCSNKLSLSFLINIFVYLIFVLSFLYKEYRFMKNR